MLWQAAIVGMDPHGASPFKGGCRAGRVSNPHNIRISVLFITDSHSLVE